MSSELIFGFENEEQAMFDNTNESQNTQSFAWYRDTPKIRDDGELCPQCGHVITLPDKATCSDLHCDSCGFQPAFMGAQMEHFDASHPESKFLTFHLIFLLFALLLYFLRLAKDGQSPWTLALIVVCPVAYIGYVVLELSIGLHCGRV